MHNVKHISHALSVKKKLLVLGILLVVAIIGGVYIIEQQSSRRLTAEQISKKFDCGPGVKTHVVRPTDVFCRNPKFYNDPDSVSYNDYYTYLFCEERFKNGPPSEAAKNNDPGYYSAYYDCKDPRKLDVLRLDFINELKQLKSTL